MSWSTYKSNEIYIVSTWYHFHHSVSPYPSCGVLVFDIFHHIIYVTLHTNNLDSQSTTWHHVNTKVHIPFLSPLSILFINSCSLLTLQSSICHGHYQMGYSYWPLPPILALVNWNIHTTFLVRWDISLSCPQAGCSAPWWRSQSVLRHKSQVHCKCNKTLVLFQIWSHYSMEIGILRLSYRATYCWLISPQLVY